MNSFDWLQYDSDAVEWVVEATLPVVFGVCVGFAATHRNYWKSYGFPRNRNKT